MLTRLFRGRGLGIGAAAFVLGIVALATASSLLAGATTAKRWSGLIAIARASTSFPSCSPNATCTWSAGTAFTVGGTPHADGSIPFTAKVTASLTVVEPCSGGGSTTGTGGGSGTGKGLIVIHPSKLVAHKLDVKLKRWTGSGDPQFEVPLTFTPCKDNPAFSYEEYGDSPNVEIPGSSASTSVHGAIATTEGQPSPWFGLPVCVAYRLTTRADADRDGIPNATDPHPHSPAPLSNPCA